MALTITFKQMMSEPEKAVKTFSQTTLSMNVTLKSDCSLKNPVFVVQSSADIGQFNYLSAPELGGREYFITEVVSVANNRWEVHCETDGLSTWWNQIKTNRAVIRRQQNMYNLYLDDPDFVTYNYDRIQTLKFPPNEFNKLLQYYLVLNGSGENAGS